MYEQSLQTIKTAIHNQVGTVTLHRPEAMNALNQCMMQELSATLLAWDARDDIRAIVLTGSEKAFAAGADIKEMVDQQYLNALQENYLNDWECISACRTPTIAAVAGYALGGGCEIAMMCDILLAADNAQFGQPEIKIGTMPGLGGTQRLSRRLGTAKAMELCLTGRNLDVYEAERAGLVSKIVPLDSLLTDAQAMAEQIASYSSVAVTLIKEAVNASASTTLEQGLLLERRAFYSLFGTKDQREGMYAFIEKRSPNFSR